MCIEVSVPTLSLYCSSLWINTLGSHGISVSLVLTHSFWKLNSVSLFYCVFLNVTFCIEKIYTLIKVHRKISPHLPGPFLSPHPRKTVVFWGIPPRISVQNTAHYAPVCTLYFFSQSILELFIHEPVDLPLSLCLACSPIAAWRSIVKMHCTSFNQFSILGCFQFFAVINRAAVNNFVHVAFHSCADISLDLSQKWDMGLYKG